MKSRTVLRAFTAGLGVCALAACGDQTHQPGSQGITTATDPAALYVADTDTNSVVTVDTETGKTVSLEVGSEPTRIARAGDRVFVTLRGERALAVLTERNGQLELTQKVSVGAEPFGVVTNSEGNRIYVASSLSGRIDEIDGGSFGVLRSWNIADEPRWLALHPSGSRLFVGSAFNGTLSSIDLITGKVTQDVIAPPPGAEEFSRRITGDLAVSANGGFLVVPMLFVDNRTTVNEILVGEPNQPVPPVRSGGYDSGASQVDGSPNTGRFRPSVVVVPLFNSEPVIAQAQLIDAGTQVEHRGYLASVTVSPDSEIILATIEASAAVLSVPVNPPKDDPGIIGTLFNSGRSSSRAVPGLLTMRSIGVVSVDFGPRAIAFSAKNSAFVFSFLDRAVRPLPVEAMRSANGTVSTITRGKVSLGDLDHVSSEILHGRRLFYAANQEMMSSKGSGVSCSTCHFDGRNDGLSWAFDRGLRQTPSLAGKISLTAPVRWEGDRVSVADDAMQTSQNLMGGQGLTENDAQAIEAFIDSSRDVDVHLAGSFDPAVLRGKEIFERAEVGCATCHLGERFTDNKTYPMFGIQVKTRSLVGVSASRPYLHDGSAADLRDVLERARSGVMGNTSSLTEAEMSDLETYLRAL